MSQRSTVRARQSSWAITVGLPVDARGYLAFWEQNLHRPMSADALGAFRRGSGNELKDSPARPAKMRATHSSSALVVNVFDYWTRNPSVVLRALGLGQSATSLQFEAQFSTGLDGEPPNLDLCIQRTDGVVVAVESKFTEWLAPKSPSKEYFKPKYFPSDNKMWAGVGLQRAQRLAEDIYAGAKRFRHLDAPQLLKHALGLATAKEPFELCYLYYEVPGEEAVLHRKELQEFGHSVAGDFPFHVRTYQEVYARIRDQAGESEAAYLAYLATRYFSCEESDVV